MKYIARNAVSLYLRTNLNRRVPSVEELVLVILALLPVLSPKHEC